MSPRRNKSGQRRKVEEARAIVAQALGDAARRDNPQPAPKYVPLTNSVPPVTARSEAVYVLTLREAATKLGTSAAEIKALIERGAVTSLMAGWTIVIPTSEVERLRVMRNDR